MTLPGFLAALRRGDPIIVRQGARDLLDLPAYVRRHGRPDVQRNEPNASRKQLRAAIAFRKEGKRK